LVPGNDTIPAGVDSGNFTSPDGIWNVAWNMTNNTRGPEIHLVVKAQTTGWVGFGFSYSGTMFGSDIIWGQV